MDVNEKGHIGLTKVMSDLTGKGYECFVPLHDYSAVDVIVLNKSHLPIRLQVKYRQSVDNKIDLPLHSVVNGKKIPIDRTAIDGWAIYCSDIDCIAYLPMIEVGQKNYFGLRLVEARCCNKDKLPLPLFNQYLDEQNLWKVIYPGR
jgi:hypothetical protein